MQSRCRHHRSAWECVTDRREEKFGEVGLDAAGCTARAHPQSHADADVNVDVTVEWGDLAGYPEGFSPVSRRLTVHMVKR